MTSERRAMLASAHYRWVASPMPGVERVMLDRVGAGAGDQCRAAGQRGPVVAGYGCPQGNMPVSRPVHATRSSISRPAIGLA